MKKNVWSIVLTYTVVAGLWIFFSDQLLEFFVPDPRLRLEWSITKGLLFVTVTAGMLYVLINRLTAKIWDVTSFWMSSERKFRTLFQEITDGVVVVELDTWKIHLGNPALLQMIGATEAELRRLTIRDLHPPDYEPELTRQLERLAQGLPWLGRNVPVRRRDGSLFYADVNSSGLELEGRRCTLAVIHDITSYRQTETALQEAKESAEAANSAKDQFIAVLSHELRTPLTPALATVAALRGQADLSEPVHTDLEVIRRNLELESKLIDDLLDVTRINRGKIELLFQRTDLHESLRAAIDICHNELQAKGIELQTDCGARPSQVWVDPPRLQQVFWNLLNNAIKFTPAGGRITVRTSSAKGAIRIEIADSGIGLSPEELPRLFQPFEQGEQTKTRRYGGLGLGLSIAKNLVELHHGSLTAWSEGKNKGTTFLVELPTAAESAPEPAHVTGPMLHPQPASRILLVDDHADTLQILSRLLKKWCYEVETADSVQSALKLAASRAFDVLISDVALPDGTGCDIMAEVRRRYGLRGIALSGYGTEDDLKASRMAGFEEHLVKPVSFPALQTALRRILAKEEKAAE